MHLLRQQAVIGSSPQAQLETPGHRRRECTGSGQMEPGRADTAGGGPGATETWGAACGIIEIDAQSEISIESAEKQPGREATISSGDGIEAE